MIDIKDKLTDEDKGTFESLKLEILVLENLVKERRVILTSHLETCMLKAGFNPKQYGLNFNFKEDKWQVQLRPDALALPGQNRAQRRQAN